MCTLRPVPPTTQNKRYIHLLAWVFRCWKSLQELLGTFPLRFSLLSTMPFTPPGENRRSSCSVFPTMWRTCSIFCAWTLLFLTEVCAQSQQRYLFIYFFTPNSNFLERFIRLKKVRIPFSLLKITVRWLELEEYCAVWAASGHVARNWMHWIQWILSTLFLNFAVMHRYYFIYMYRKYLSPQTNLYMWRKHHRRVWSNREPGVPRSLPSKYQMCVENHSESSSVFHS